MSSTRISPRQLEPRRVPKQSRSTGTVEAIVEAAAQVFERHGYASGTTNRIAERAGVSIGSVYQYFPNKDTILLALVRRHIAEVTELLGPYTQLLRNGARLEEVLDGVVRSMVELHARSPRLHRVLFEETPLPPTLRAELAHLESEITGIVAGALRAELRPPPANPEFCAALLLSTIEGLTHRLTLQPVAGTNPETIVLEITRLVRAYIRDMSAQ